MPFISHHDLNLTDEEMLLALDYALHRLTWWKDLYVGNIAMSWDSALHHVEMERVDRERGIAHYAARE